MIENYSTIIWDWNGTLIDDVGICAGLVTKVLEQFGLGSCSVEQYREVYTHPIKDAYAALGAEMTDDEYAAMTHDWLAEYEKARKSCSLHLGVTEILTTLRGQSKDQYLLSAHRHDLVLKAVADFNLTEYFNKISGLELGGGHGKIETGQALLSEIGQPAADILFIGDSFHDHEVAELIGAQCHLIASGADARHKLERSGRCVFSTLQEWSSAVGLPLG